MILRAWYRAPKRLKPAKKKKIQKKINPETGPKNKNKIRKWVIWGPLGGIFFRVWGTFFLGVGGPAALGKGAKHGVAPVRFGYGAWMGRFRRFLFLVPVRFLGHPLCFLSLFVVGPLGCDPGCHLQECF